VQGKLPVVSFGNGGCVNIGSAFKTLLGEVASHGYLAIATGPIGPRAGWPTRGPSRRYAFEQSKTESLVKAIDWAIAENARKGSPYYGRIDTTKIAVAGQSCGGLQAIAVGADPRVTTVLVLNSGIIRGGIPTPDGGTRQPAGYLPASDADLPKLHTPMLYLIGGEKDQAHRGAEGDFEAIQKVPVFNANTPVGHGGTWQAARWRRHGQGRHRLAELAAERRCRSGKDLQRRSVRSLQRYGVDGEAERTGSEQRTYEPTVVTCMCALIALTLTLSAQAPPRARTGDQRRQYVFTPTGQQMPYRVYVPKTWDGKASLPIILMLHGAGANEGTYLDQADGLLMKLAEQHGYIVVSPLGFTPLGAYGNPLRLPAVFGQAAAAASQRAAVTPARQRELDLSELEVITALEIVTEEYGADRARTFLAGHSMGSGGAWHLAARYPERWRAVAPMSGPFIDEATYPFDRIKRLPIFMTEGTGATPSLEGSRVLARYMKERGFAFEYLEVDGNHGSMVPMVWPRIFEFFNRQGR
jgi:poly(3-hydroxybutyrate) depolymerase